MSPKQESSRYCKLRSGDWGVRVPGKPKPGQTISVQTKGGKVKTETIESVIWTGNGVSLCSIVPRERKQRGGTGGGRFCSACGHDADMCADMDCCCRMCGGMMR